MMKTRQSPAAPGVGGVFSPAIAPAAAESVRVLRCVVAATDGGPSADAVIALADALARRRGVSVRVVAVVEPVPTNLPLGEAGLLTVPFERLEAEQRARVAQRVREQLLELAASSTRFEVDVVTGSVAPAIVEAARGSHADVILTGIGRHRVVDRLFGAETALNVMRLAEVPVLAAAPELRDLPRHVLVGMDFGASSIRAASVALQLLASGGRLTLAHVKPAFDLSPAEEERWRSVYMEGVARSFEKVLRELEPAPGIRVETSVLDGNAAIELLDLAQRAKADLIATGRHSHTLFERFVIGGVATRLLRTASCSMLVAPAVS